MNTGGELNWMKREATEDRKAMASEAYGLYDQLGNVFTTGDLGDKASGVLDYIKASATDITNYVGLATGGYAKMATFAGQSAAKKQVRAAMLQAGKDALLKKSSKKQVQKAVNKARDEITSKLNLKFANTKPGKE